MKGTEAIAKALQAEGVEILTCFPLNQIIDAASAIGIRPIVTRTERVAVNIADGYSRMTGGRKIGVAAVQYGPGAENAFGGVAQAFADSTPLLCLSGAYELSRLSIPPNFKAARNFRHVTKWSETVTDLNDIPQIMQRAFALLRSGKSGPVLLEFPSDVMLSEFKENPIDHNPQKTSRPAGDTDDVKEAVEALLAANAPIIMAGQGILYAEAWEELKTLAELLQIPVMSTLNGKSAFPENHPLALGTANGFSKPETVKYFLNKTDLVFGIGTSFTLSKFSTPVPRGKKITQITIDESDISKDYPIACSVIGDAKRVLAQIIAEVKSRVGSEGRGADDQLISEIQTVKNSFLEKWKPRLTSDEEPISPYRVVREIMDTVNPHQTVITHDSGCPRDQLVPLYEAAVPHGYIGWGKSTPLGSSLGLIMGAKLAKPDWLAINLMGDTAFGMVGMDLETAVRNQIPILTILMNNGVMGGYTSKLPISTARDNVHRLSGDYAKVAEGLGSYTERVEKVDELKPALQRAISQTENGQTAFLEIITAEDPEFPGAK